MRKFKLLLTGTVGACVIFAGTMPALANNHTNTTFDFNKYNADGTDIAFNARAKKDSSASYVKLKTTTGATLSISIAGTNNKSQISGINPKRCSSVVRIKPGSYKYITNTVHQRNYKYAYIVAGSHVNKKINIHGEWSPDNISGK